MELLHWLSAPTIIVTFYACGFWERRCKCTDLTGLWSTILAAQTVCISACELITAGLVCVIGIIIAWCFFFLISALYIYTQNLMCNANWKYQVLHDLKKKFYDGSHAMVRWMCVYHVWNHNWWKCPGSFSTLGMSWDYQCWELLSRQRPAGPHMIVPYCPLLSSASWHEVKNLWYAPLVQERLTNYTCWNLVKQNSEESSYHQPSQCAVCSQPTNKVYPITPNIPQHRNKPESR